MKTTPLVISTSDLDQILALQLLVAWAGESLCEPARLGWWRTDLVDEEGGAGLLRELMPKTWRWASVEAARRAATAVDARARATMALGGQVRTLYSWGFRLDEKLDERLLAQKEAGGDPWDLPGLPLRPKDGETLDREALANALSALADGAHRAALNGREVLRPGRGPVALARSLVAALVPFPAEWPAPFIVGEELS